MTAAHASRISSYSVLLNEATECAGESESSSITRVKWGTGKLESAGEGSADGSESKETGATATVCSAVGKITPLKKAVIKVESGA